MEHKKHKEERKKRKVIIRFVPFPILFAPFVFIFFALFVAQSHAVVQAQSRRTDVVSLSSIQSRIIQLEDERNLNGDELTGLLKHASAAVRERAALAIGRIGDKRGTDALIELFNQDRDASVRAMAAFALGEMEDAKAVAALSGAISTLLAPPHKRDEPPLVRARVCEALGKILSANRPKEPDLGIVRHADEIAKQLPDPQARLTADEKLLAGLAITALMRLQVSVSVEPLMRQLKSNDAEIRAQAANALARLRQPLGDAVPALIEALNDGNADVRANAARALGVSKDARAVGPLLKTLRDKSEHAQVNAVRALAAIGDRRAVEPLIELAKLSDPKATIHRQRPPSLNLMLECVIALGTLKDERALPFLRELRAREGIGAYPELEIAMGRFGAASYFSPAEDLLSHDTNGSKSFINLIQSIGEAGSELGKELLLMLYVKNYLESKAQPQILRSLAKLKPVSLPFILRESLLHEDVFVRATAASLINEMIEGRNLDALIKALAGSKNDRENDAKLAILRAIQSTNRLKPSKRSKRRLQIMTTSSVVRPLTCSGKWAQAISPTASASFKPATTNASTNASPRA